MNVSNPVLSPSLNEKGHAFLTDENGKKVSLYVLAVSDSSGNLGLPDLVEYEGVTSQVTSRQGEAYIVSPSGQEVPVIGVVSVDNTGALVPFKAPTSALSDKLLGKFQSAVTLATGASQNVAHGLAVVPSLVLVSIYDTNGVALPFVIVEGVHDATNIKLTITASLKFKVIALK